MIDNAALNDLLNVYFRNGTPATAYYIGLVDATGFAAFDPSDTMAAHSGWTELVDYSESTRQLWSPSASTAEQLVNPALATFTMSSPSSVYGVFLCTDNTKSGTSGLLVGPVKLDNTQVLPTNEKFKVQATVIAVSGQSA